MTPLVRSAGLSSSQVKKAGSLVRRARRDGLTSGQEVDALAEAINIIETHRATFRAPLVTANNGLRSMVRTLGIDGQVSQRLKRMPTILDKLEREPTLALDRMQDIGGCRAVVRTRDDVTRLAERLAMRRPPLRVADYVAQPRQSGYRGIHVIVEYGSDCPRPIEVQIRTLLMHQWATTVEDISGNSGINYKMDGASPMQLFLECYARVLDFADRGEAVPDGLLDEYGTLVNTAFDRS